MGMRYNITFHNAVIPPKNYDQLIGEGYEDDERREALALSAVREYLTIYAAEPVTTPDGIDLSGCGFYDDASYGYGKTLTGVLRFAIHRRT